MTEAGHGGLAARLMAFPTSEILPPEIELALAYSEPAMRGALTILFEFDVRLGRIVAGTNEPMLGQMRLAWWRDALALPVGERPGGDVVLDGIARHWQGREAALRPLVDGWEHLLAEPPLSESDARGFLEGRCTGVVAAFPAPRDAHRVQAMRWACADLAAKVTHPEERALFLRLGQEVAAVPARLPRSARGLAVLGALGARALKRGGRPLMEGRGAALTIARAAIIGR